MDALYGMVPEQRIDPNHNQPDPVGHAWLRSVRELRDGAVDMYMPRGEDGRRRLDLPLAVVAVCGVTTFSLGVYNTCRLLSLSMNNDIADVDSLASAESQHYLIGGMICSSVLLLSIKAFEYVRDLRP